MVVKVGIGFDYHNFLLVLFDWYYPHLYNYCHGQELSREAISCWKHPLYKIAGNFDKLRGNVFWCFKFPVHVGNLGIDILPVQV